MVNVERTLESLFGMIENLQVDRLNEEGFKIYLNNGHVLKLEVSLLSQQFLSSSGQQRRLSVVPPSSLSLPVSIQSQRMRNPGPSHRFRQE